MKRILAIGVILLFIGMSISSSTGFNVEQSNVITSNGKTLYVGGSGLGNYSKIQDAIDNASDGDTVFVYNDSAPYYEYPIKINKSINLIGEDRESTIIFGTEMEWEITIIYICHNHVNISGFTIMNAIWGYVIYIGAVDYIRISDCIINVDERGAKNYGNGTSIYTTNHTIIENCTYVNAGTCISLYGGSYNKFINNILEDSGRGFLLWDDMNLIANNIIRNNLWMGLSMWHGNDNLIYHNNFINNGQHAEDYPGNNTWDNGYPSGGNYWDDYTGNDSDGDGIGDTPYPIPLGYNEDRYPLMKPWGGINRPYGPSKGLPGVNYTFCIDLPDDVECEPYDIFWDWGDGTTEEWMGPYKAGETVCATHSWARPGEYHIRVKIRDGCGNSYWSLPFTISIGLPIFEIKNIRGGLFKVTVTIKNIGEVDTPDVHWRITLVGGIILLGRVTEGVIPDIPSGEEVNITSGLIVGFGAVKIIVEVWIGEEPPEVSEYSGFVLLFFIQINPGG